MRGEGESGGGVKGRIRLWGERFGRRVGGEKGREDKRKEKGERKEKETSRPKARDGHRYPCPAAAFHDGSC